MTRHNLSVPAIASLLVAVSGCATRDAYLVTDDSLASHSAEQTAERHDAKPSAIPAHRVSDGKEVFLSPADALVPAVPGGTGATRVQASHSNPRLTTAIVLAIVGAVEVGCGLLVLNSGWASGDAPLGTAAGAILVAFGGGGLLSGGIVAIAGSSFRPQEVDRGRSDVQFLAPSAAPLTLPSVHAASWQVSF